MQVPAFDPVPTFPIEVNPIRSKLQPPIPQLIGKNDSLAAVYMGLFLSRGMLNKRSGKIASKKVGCIDRLI